MLLFFLSALSSSSNGAAAFQTPSPPSSAVRALRTSSATTTTSSSSSSSSLNYAATAQLDPAFLAPSGPRFEERMRNLVMPKRNNDDDNNGSNSNKKQAVSRNANVDMPRNMYVSEKGLESYKELIGDETERLTVVRFYAPWCQACKRVSSLFDRMARQNPDVKFVQVPISEEANKLLVAGLGVPAIPYGHVYHPTAGLVEERSMNKKYFGDFSRIVDSYTQDGCALADDVDPYTGVYESPYQKYDTAASTSSANRSSNKAQL